MIDDYIREGPDNRRLNLPHYFYQMTSLFTSTNSCQNAFMQAQAQFPILFLHMVPKVKKHFEFKRQEETGTRDQVCMMGMDVTSISLC